MIKLNNIKIGNDLPFVLISGPCAIESRDITFRIAEELKKLTSSLKIPFIFKASYDKANRTSIDGYRGLGIDEGLRILSDIKKEFDVPIISDVHSVEEIKKAHKGFY